MGIGTIQNKKDESKMVDNVFLGNDYIFWFIN
jgi:hypothetical protein